MSSKRLILAVTYLKSKTFKRIGTLEKKLLVLEQNTNKWLASFQSQKQLHTDATALKKYEALSKLKRLLQTQLQEEAQSKEALAEDLIDEGAATAEAFKIDPKYKEIKELQTFSTEDNIRDTNPILILSFGKLLELTIDYLQNLKGMLLVLGKYADEKDRIDSAIREAILNLYKGGQKNSYAFNTFIYEALDEAMTEVLNGNNAVSLAIFCDHLADRIQTLIKKLQDTPQPQLRQELGKKFRKHKKSPYPYVGKILTAIDLYDLPHDTAGDTAKEEQFKRLSNWYSSFLQDLLIFEKEHQTDFFTTADLKSALDGFAATLSSPATPISVSKALTEKVK